MPAPPKCTRLGPQCKAIDVTILVDNFDEDSSDTSLDHNATWLMGHTERIAFGKLRRDQDELLVDAILHVPCKYLRTVDGRATCKAHGFKGKAPPDPAMPTQRLQLGDDRFRIVGAGKQVTRRMALAKPSLPVLEDNPCEGAPCRTSDNTKTAACCRDLQMEVLCRRGQTAQEALIRSRKSPYLCKVEREGDATLEFEMITACGYLEPGGVACTLHGRKRANGDNAKPQLCYDWPPKRGTIHPGCVFRGRGKRKLAPAG